jgi:hypothetical protein
MKKFWRVDTKALVGGVLLGIVFMLVQQISHRIDSLFSPAVMIMGGITWATFTALGALLFGQPSGIIVGETQALVANASGLSPVALFFFLANGLGSFSYSLVSHRLSMEKWSHHLLAQIVANLVGNACVLLGLITVLKLPPTAAIISSVITCTAGIIGATVLTKLVYDNLKRSRLLDMSY